MTGHPGLENVADAYPLTPLQEGMLFHTLAEPGSDVFMNQRSIDVDGELDPAAFRAAWERLVERHDSLRTAFVWDGLDRPLQIVRSSAPLEWHELDWAHLSPVEQSERFRRLLDEDMQRGFDLQTAPLTRMTLIRMRQDGWRWLWACHHLIADAWSVQVLLDELESHYSELRGGSAAELSDPFTYRDFVGSVLARDPARDQTFWRGRLAGFTAPHRLEVPGLPPAPDAIGHRALTVELDEGTSTALQTAAAGEGVTLNSALVAAWAVMLSRWTRETDVLFGATSAGRDATLPGADRAVGLFINTLPIRLAVEAEESVGEFWRSVQRHQQELYPFEQSSLAAVQQWSDAPAGEALFESIFVFGNRPALASDGKSGYVLTGVEFFEHSNYPLAILAEPGSSLQLRFIYDSARFSHGAVVSLAAQTVHLLAQFARNPGLGIAQLELLPPAELAPLQTLETGPRLDPTDETIHRLIARTAAERPDEPAVVFEDQVITYEQLEEAAGRVAIRLQAAGVGPNCPVGLYLGRSVELVVGMLGILKAGGAYVPLDPDYPPKHIRRLLEEDGIDIVLTEADRRDDVPAGTSVVTIEGEETAAAVSGPPTLAPRADDMAYVIYTSGSTGRPKGVVVSHRNLVQSTRARTAHYRSPVGRFLLLSSFAFDSSVAGIFWTLTSGGTLVLPSPGLEHDVNGLLALAATKRISHLLGLPALYQVMLEQADGAELESLEVAIVAGEACPPSVPAVHFSRLPQTELHNEYGPTEATVWCTVHQAEEADRGKPLPIGRPIAGTTVHLLDEHGHRVAPGFVGEIWVGGAGVTSGYLNRPDLTAERFTTVRLDGRDGRLYRTGDLGSYRTDDGALLYLGRADGQLKVRGHRIEPGAIEEALRSHSAVAEAAVSSRDTNGRAAAQLVGYVAFHNDPVEPALLRDFLRNRLPHFMVPDVFVPLDGIPRLPNGKVDTGSLPEPAVIADSDPGSIALPQSEIEVTLAAIWSDVLGVEQEAIRADSDFFLMGGHSLLAIRVMSKVHSSFGVSLPLASLLDAPHLSEFAALLEEGRRPPPSPLFVPIRPTGEATLYLIHPGGGNVLVYEPLARHMSDRIAVVGIQARGIDGREEPDHTFEEMAVQYAEEIRKHAGSGPVNLAGYSTGGLIAFEVARILEQEGYQVGLVALLDTLFPARPGLPARLTRQLQIIREGRWSGVRTVADWWWGSLRELAGRIRHGPRWKYLLSRRRPLPPELAARRITHIALRDVRRYQPRDYGGTITYIKAVGDGTRYHDSIPRWRAVAGEVVVREAPGRHAGDGNMVSEPHVGAVAALIEEHLMRSARPVG